VISTLIKIVVMNDWVEPSFILSENKSDKITDLAGVMWTFTMVLMLECLFGLLYSLVFDEDHEPMVLTVLGMTAISLASIFPITDHMSTLYDMQNWKFWIGMGIFLLVVAGAIYNSRRRVHTEYERIGEGETASLKV
jgi:predicted membrane channel-forming protein YqfA (hemolysin III family)